MQDNISQYHAEVHQEPLWQPVSLMPATLPYHIQDCLKADISLTQRLQQFGKFQVEVISEYWKEGQPSEYALLGISIPELLWHRDVILKVNNNPWVAASTLIPRQTLEHIPQLKNLGTRSLGDLIFMELAGFRSVLEYTLLSSQHGLYQLANQDNAAPQILWARRSVLTAKNNSLLVNEIFLESMLNAFEKKQPI